MVDSTNPPSLLGLALTTTSPSLSSYLLAFIVGEFDYVEDSDGEVVVRVYTPLGKAEQGRFALDVRRMVSI